MTERWRVLDDRWTNPFTGEPERHICKSRADDATVIAVEGPHCDDDARWVAAALNAVDGVPTEVLEAGEVVPLALVDSIIREVLTNEEKYVPAAMLGNQGLNAYHGIMLEIRNALSRLQQNGGWWETGDQEPRRLREDCYEPGQQMGGGQG